MVNEQVLEGKWNEIQGKLRERWGQLGQDELAKFEGDVQQLVGLIQQRTGVAREKVEAYLTELTDCTSVEQATAKPKLYAQHVAENASEYAQQVGESIREGAQTVSDSARASYVQTERLGRRKPVESLAVCFGTGLITGVVLGLVLRSK